MYFTGVALFPKDPADREAWTAALGPHNPSMVRSPCCVFVCDGDDSTLLSCHC